VRFRKRFMSSVIVPMLHTLDDSGRPDHLRLYNRLLLVVVCLSCLLSIISYSLFRSLVELFWVPMTSARFELVLTLMRSVGFAILELSWTTLQGAWYHDGPHEQRWKHGKTTWLQFFLNCTVTLWIMDLHFCLVAQCVTIENIFWFVFTAPLAMWLSEALEGYLIMFFSRDGKNPVWHYPREKWYVLCHGNIRLDYVACWWFAALLEYGTRFLMMRGNVPF